MEVDAYDKRHRTRSKGIRIQIHTQRHCHSGWPSLPQQKTETWTDTSVHIYTVHTPLQKFQTAEFPFLTAVSLFLHFSFHVSQRKTISFEAHIQSWNTTQSKMLINYGNNLKTVGNSIRWHSVQLLNIVLARRTALWQMNDNLVGSQNHSLVTSNRQTHHPLACHSCSSTIFNMHQWCAV